MSLAILADKLTYTETFVNSNPSFAESHFTSWVIHKINASDFFNPCLYKLRPIVDTGCIATSLEAAKIDLFDRETVQDQITCMRLAQKISGFVLIAFSCVGLPFAMTYHAGLSITYAFSSIIASSQEEKDAYIKKTNLYAKIALSELMNFSSTLFKASAVFSFTSLVARVLVVTVVFLNVRDQFLVAEPTNPIMFSPGQAYGYNKSLFLRNEFGIVSTNKDLLSYNCEKDQDIAFSFDANEISAYERHGTRPKELFSLEKLLKNGCTTNLLTLELYPNLTFHIGQFSNIYLKEKTNFF